MTIDSFDDHRPPLAEDGASSGEPGRVGVRGFVTSIDVARHAGVSRSAVSRAFTPGASVSPDLRKRVMDAADALGYRVNRLARGLISARSSLVGLVCANLDTPFPAALLTHTIKALAARGLHPLLAQFDSATSDVHDEIQRILEFRVEAIVVMSGSPPVSVIDECLANGVRLILVNRSIDATSALTVVSDDFGGAAAAADRLAAAGLRRVAVLASTSGTPTQSRRVKGFLDRARDLGLEAADYRFGPTTYDAGHAAARQILAAVPGSAPDGIFCTTDLLALGLIDAARNDFNLSIPDDLSVIGFDDIPQSSWGAYRLTTVRQRPDAIAEGIVAAIAAGPDAAETVTTIPVHLVERATVRPVR